MIINDYEKALLGIILKFPNGSTNVPQRVIAELDATRFGSQPHKRIYKAINSLVLNNEIPNTVNVATELQDRLANCGGIEYLESLIRFPETVGVYGDDGFGKWVRFIDGAGRLRHLGDVVTKYNKLYDDLDNLVSKTNDVDEFLSNFMAEVNKGLSSVRTSYKHIKEAVELERRHAKLEGEGMVVDILPCGWPNLEKYMIPRPNSFGTVMGLSSMGKTSFAFQLGLRVSIHLYKEGLPGVVSFNSLETPAKKIARKLACILSSTNSMHLAHGDLSSTQFDRYMRALDYISDLPIRYDDNPDITTDELSWQAIALDITEKRILGISDYAELFRDKAQSEELRISSIVRNHRRIAWRVESCEILISQASNPHPSTKMIMLSNARYSGAFEQALDWGIIIHNPIQMRKRSIPYTPIEGLREDVAYAIIQKNKEYDVGQEPFNWIPEYTSFEDLSLPMSNSLYRMPKKAQF